MRSAFTTTALSLACALALTACGKPGEPPAPTAQPQPPAAPITSGPAQPPGASQTPAPAAPPAAATPAATHDQAPAAGDGVVTHFKAHGNSPAWNAEVQGASITFEVPETMGPDKAKRTAPVERLAYAKGVNFNGKDGATEFTLDISGKECTRTGDKREFTATLSYGSSTYHGCADAVR